MGTCDWPLAHSVLPPKAQEQILNYLRTAPQNTRLAVQKLVDSDVFHLYCNSIPFLLLLFRELRQL